MPELKEEIVEFLQDIYPLLFKGTPSLTGTILHTSEHQHVISQVLTEVIEWAKALVEAGQQYEVSVFGYPCPTRSFIALNFTSGTIHCSKWDNIPG